MVAMYPESFLVHWSWIDSIETFSDYEWLSQIDGRRSYIITIVTHLHDIKIIRIDQLFNHIIDDNSGIIQSNRQLNPSLT